MMVLPRFLSAQSYHVISHMLQVTYHMLQLTNHMLQVTYHMLQGGGCNSDRVHIILNNLMLKFDIEFYQNQITCILEQFFNSHHIMY